MRLQIQALATFLAVGLSVLPGEAVNTLGRTYGFGFEKGNLVRNWSFEEAGDNWFNESWSGTQVVTARFPAKSASLTAPTGSYVGKFTGTNGTAGSLSAMKSDFIPVEPGTKYVLSFFVYSTGNTNGVAPSVEYFSDNAGTSISSFSGQEYFVSSNSWVPNSMTFTTPANATNLQVSLIKAGVGKGGTFYLDDINMELGSIATTRDRVSESISFWGDNGVDFQSQLKIAGGGNAPATRKYLVDGISLDAMRRPNRQYMPFINSGVPDYDGGFDAKSKLYNNGTNGMGSLGGYPYSQKDYLDEPGSRASSAHEPGQDWQNKDLKGDFCYVDDLNIPGNLESPTATSAEPPFLYTWSKDVEGRYTLNWTDGEGHLVKQASKLSGNWMATTYEYFPNGKLKKVMTPLDNPADASSQPYRQITNYNSLGEVTSTYTADRGLTKFYYNRLGQVRFIKVPANDYNIYSYTDYDIQDRPISVGEQKMLDFDPSLAEVRVATNGIKTEHAGYLYDDLATFEARVGFPLSDLLPSVITLGVNGNGRLVCEYALNNESGYSFSAQRKFVATFYNYNKYGEVTDAYKYIGMPATLSQRIEHAIYSYDEAHRLVRQSLYDNGVTPTLLSEKKINYDAIGRISRINGIGNRFLSGYTYYDWGGLKTVVLGGSGSTADGTRIEYYYHSHSWVKEIRAIRQSTGEVVFQQFLGYEDKSNPDAKVPATVQPKYDGSISQQLYKFATDVLSEGPVRLTNYQYDDFGRMVTADARVNGNSNPLDGLQNIDFANLQWSDTDDLDSRFQYDELGRITQNRSGVSSADAANYTYKTNSFQLDRVSGKLGAHNSRDASADGTFIYDNRGRMIEDHSKGLYIHYGWNDLPVDYTISNGDGTQTTEYTYYDARGTRVGRTQVKYDAFLNGSGGVASFIGNEEAGDPAGMYTSNSLLAEYNHQAYMAAYGNIDPSVQELTFYYVFDQGITNITDQGETDFQIVPLSRSNGPTISIKVVGILKGSQAYTDLLKRYFSGTLLSSTVDVNLLGGGDRRWDESYDANGTVTATKGTTGILGASNSVIGRITNTGTYEFYLKNHQGSTLKDVNDDGTFLSSANSTYDYMAYGDPKALKEGPDKVAEGYTGKEHDDALTRLTYFGARWYDPELGIWMSPDKMNEFFNPYGRSGDPINRTDPDGNCEILCWTAIGIIFAVSAYLDYEQERERENNGEPGGNAGVGICVGNCAPIYFTNNGADTRDQVEAYKAVDPDATASADAAVNDAVNNYVYGDPVANFKSAVWTDESSWRPSLRKLTPASPSAYRGWLIAKNRIEQGEGDEIDYLQFNPEHQFSVNVGRPVGRAVGTMASLFVPGGAEIKEGILAAEGASGAASALNGARLSKHLSQLEKYGQAGFRELENGSLQYYGKIRPASNPGEMIGARVVREWNPSSNATKTWMETLDQSGTVRIIRPETGGAKIHYMYDASGKFIGAY